LKKQPLLDLKKNWSQRTADTTGQKINIQMLAHFFWPETLKERLY